MALCKLRNRFVLTMDLISSTSASTSDSRKTDLDWSYRSSKTAKKVSSGYAGIPRHSSALLPVSLAMAKVHPAESAISLLAVKLFLAVVIQCSCLSTRMTLHDSYLYSSDSAVVDYQVLGQEDGTGCMVMFNSLPTYSLESYQ